jgi:hypothetical protein
MANRFDVPYGNRQDAISTFVPLPLNEIGELAKDYSNRYKQGRALPGSMDLLAQKVQAAPMDYELKRKWLEESHKAISEITDKATERDWADPGFQRRVQAKIMERANDPVLNTISGNKKWFDDEYTKYASNKDNAQDLDFTLEKDNHHPTGFKQNLDGKSYSGLKVTKHSDPYKQKAEIMSHINESGSLINDGFDYSKGLQVGPDGTYTAYNKTTKGWEGVSKNKVDEISRISTRLYGNTDAGKYEIQKYLRDYNDFGGEAYNWDYNRLQAEANNGNQVAIQLLNEVNNRFKNDLFDVGAKQIGGKYTRDIDSQTMHDTAKAKKEEEKHHFDLNSNVETPDLMNLTDPLYKEASDSGVINKDGTINYNALTESKPVKAGKDWVNVDGQNMPAHDKLGKLMFVASTALGIDPKMVKTNPDPKKGEVSQDEVLKQYQGLVKTRTYGSQLQPLERNLMSVDLVNHPSGYTFIDDKGQALPVPPALKTPMSEGDNPNINVTERHFIDGKSKYKVEFTNDDGTVTTAWARPVAKQINKHFDVIAKVSESQLKYIRGEFNLPETKDLIKAADGKPLKINGMEQVSHVEGSREGEKIVTFSNPKNRKDAIVARVTKMKDPKTGRLEDHVEILGDFANFAPIYENEFYNSNEGAAYLQNLETNNVKAKSRRQS